MLRAQRGVHHMTQPAGVHTRTCPHAPEFVFLPVSVGGAARVYVTAGLFLTGDAPHFFQHLVCVLSRRLGLRQYYGLPLSRM